MSLKSIKMKIEHGNPHPYRFHYLLHTERYFRFYTKYNRQTKRTRWTFTGKEVIEFKNESPAKIIFLIHRALRKRKTFFVKGF